MGRFIDSVYLSGPCTVGWSFPGAAADVLTDAVKPIGTKSPQIMQIVRILRIEQNSRVFMTRKSSYLGKSRTNHGTTTMRVQCRGEGGGGGGGWGKNALATVTVATYALLQILHLGTAEIMKCYSALLAHSQGLAIPVVIFDKLHEAFRNQLRTGTEILHVSCRSNLAHAPHRCSAINIPRVVVFVCVFSINCVFHKKNKELMSILIGSQS